MRTLLTNAKTTPGSIPEDLQADLQRRGDAHEAQKKADPTLKRVKIKRMSRSAARTQGKAARGSAGPPSS